MKSTVNIEDDPLQHLGDDEVKIESAEVFTIVKDGIKVSFPTDLFKRLQEKYPEKGNKETWVQQNEPPKPPEFEVVKSVNSVNKNAYEIRTEVLGMALDWIKHKSSYASNNVELTGITEDTVLNVAKKFYQFVENRR